jgi:predicted membrane chloride channel (bestrophin family)
LPSCIYLSIYLCIYHDVALFRQRRPSFTSIWDKEDWAIHTSRKRYLRYILEFPTSRLLRRCLPQMAVLLLWSLIAMWIGSREVSVAKLHIGLTPMSLISTFVAALLTLRSNQGLSRLTEARNAFGQVVVLTREMSQLISTSVYPVDPQMGLLAGKRERERERESY